MIDGKNETITTPRLSFRFLNVSPTVERQLQRIIFSLEREAREKSGQSARLIYIASSACSSL